MLHIPNTVPSSPLLQLPKVPELSCGDKAHDTKLHQKCQWKRVMTRDTLLVCYFVLSSLCINNQIIKTSLCYDEAATWVGIDHMTRNHCVGTASI